MTRTARRLAAATLATVAAVALSAAAADATVVDRFHFAFSEQETFDDCGFPIVDDFSINGSTVIRQVKGTQTLFFSSVTFHSEDILTNPETGAWFRVTANETSKEGGPVTQVAPGVYTYTIRENGTPITIWDSSGHKVVADHGSIRSSITFDTGGDDVPGGTEVESHIVSVSGPHPLLDDALFCQVANDLIG